MGKKTLDIDAAFRWLSNRSSTVRIRLADDNSIHLECHEDAHTLPLCQCFASNLGLALDEAVHLHPAGLRDKDREVLWPDNTPETPVAESKQFRVDLDGVLQELKSSERKSRERSLAITKIQEAIMWLGMDLKAIREETGAEGTENPYPSSYDPSSPHIEPTAQGLKL